VPDPLGRQLSLPHDPRNARGDSWPSLAPQPLLLFTKAPGEPASRGGRSSAVRRSQSPDPAQRSPAPGLGRLVSPSPRRECRRREPLSRVLYRQPRKCCPLASTSRRFQHAKLGREAAGWARIAGLGRGPRQLARQQRAPARRDEPRQPGPGAPALPGSRGKEARAEAPSPEVPKRREPRGPQPSWPGAGPAGTRGTARHALSTPHRLRAARGVPRLGSGLGWAGPGPGGPCGSRARGTHCSRR
jgi:hypothetical protein